MALAMFTGLQSIVKESLTLSIDFTAFDEKTTFLFVSSEFAKMMTTQAKQIEMLFILESDSTKVDYQKRFDCGVDLIFQLADEIYRCYMIEAREDFELGDLSRANIKEECANQVHRELKRIYNSMYKDDHSIVKLVDTRTTIVWLDIRRQRIDAIDRLNELSSTIVSSFLVSDDRITCEEYLMASQSKSRVFLVINTDQEISLGIDLYQLPNVKIVYYCDETFLKTEWIITKYNDLCFRLMSDLARHYNHLGCICSARHDLKTAQQMFMKTYELYHILAKL